VTAAGDQPVGTPPQQALDQQGCGGGVTVIPPHVRVREGPQCRLLPLMGLAGHADRGRHHPARPSWSSMLLVRGPWASSNRKAQA
jgi:hypothetical protein